MTQRELITAILQEAGHDPDMRVGERSAFSMLEAAVWGVLEEIDEEKDNQ